MDVLAAALTWFADPTHWSGAAGIPNRLYEHVSLSVAVVAIALLIGLPIGLAIGHTGRGALFAVSTANIGRAVPSYAVLLMLFPVFGFGFSTALPALVLLAIPPILTNSYAGLREVDRELIEAARGMGMSELQLLRRVEIPVAMPVILAGTRTAAVQVVATATLAALVAGGGLGRYVVDGFATFDQAQLVGGATLVGLLAILTERGITLLEHRVVSPGIAPESGRRPSRFGGRARPEPGESPSETR